ncbi:DUF4174 domain-containing protein [Vibrio comitans]|uniref:DUF4174 domain-containing protein n=1 Tax=Vibrio comitans NBRC 102076 TaxID=1219078 RepID=A0A4Y3IS98_9VIBR|nr:DUF4174 domain-containing protein [Vibrio comitans]GEA61620.1 hypothetical protein VCO01S_28130 [Vibrio comitans NBRC 102076]
MKGMFLLPLVATFSVFASSHDGNQMNQLSEMKWQYRVLLIQSSVSVSSELRDATNGIIERDLAWFVISPDNIHSNIEKPLSQNLQDELRHESSRANVVLIGKDGGVKKVDDELNLPDVFSTIDEMPMRQAEMRQ